MESYYLKISFEKRSKDFDEMVSIKLNGLDKFSDGLQTTTFETNHKEFVENLPLIELIDFFTAMVEEFYNSNSQLIDMLKSHLRPIQHLVVDDTFCDTTVQHLIEDLPRFNKGLYMMSEFVDRINEAVLQGRLIELPKNTKIGRS